MDLDRTYHTRWFHPGRAEDDGVPGSYRVDADGSLMVRVYEEWDREGSLSLLPNDDFPTVLMGEVFREAVTLLDCREVGGMTGVTSQKDVEIRCDYALEGSVYLETDADQRFTRLRLRLTDQDAWTEWSSFGVERKRNRDGLVRAVATFERPTDLSASIDGATLTLRDNSTVHEDVVSHKVVLQTHSQFEFAFDEPLGIREAMTRYAYPLQVLMMSATSVMPGAISMSVTNDEWFKGVDTSPLTGSWLRVRRFHGGDRGLLPGSIQYLHRLDDFDFMRQMPQVFESVAKHRLAFERYAEMLSRSGGGTQSQFIALTQVIDAYDRSNHPGEKRTGQFGVPVRRMDLEAGHFLKDRLRLGGDWAFYVSELRNIVTHGDEKTRRLVSDSTPLVVATEALGLLFEIHILMGFGFDIFRARELVESRHPFTWRAETIRGGFQKLVDFVEKEPKTKS